MCCSRVKCAARSCAFVSKSATESINIPWQKKNRPNRDWIIRHGLRSLIKQGNSDALALTGFGKPDKLKVQLSVEPASIRIGQSVMLALTVKNNSKRSQSLMIDYVAVSYTHLTLPTKA